MIASLSVPTGDTESSTDGQLAGEQEKKRVYQRGVIGERRASNGRMKGECFAVCEWLSKRWQTRKEKRKKKMKNG